MTIAGDTLVNGTVTLREAIESINQGADLNADVSANRVGAYGTNDTVKFNIGNGVQVIAPNTALPPITAPVTIDGTTQPGYTGARPLIEIDGAALGGNGIGLDISAPNCDVRGLSIVNCGAAAVRIQNVRAGNNVVDACFLGLDPNGVVHGNSYGVYVIDSSSNIIGAVPGVAGVGGNVISGNLTGVRISGPGSTGNTVASNFIGTDPLGLALNFGNTDDGVNVTNQASNNHIGDEFNFDGNLISGNGRYGVNLDGSASDNFVRATSSV